MNKNRNDISHKKSTVESESTIRMAISRQNYNNTG